VGEIGLDYHYDFAPRAVQHAVFRAQLRVARERGLPVVIHTREAEADTLAMIAEMNGSPASDGFGADTSGASVSSASPLAGVFHCFSGDAALAAILAERGWYASFAGTVTFKNARNLRDALEILPRALLLVESDAPFLTPHPHRGRPNGPYLLPWTVRAMADSIGTDPSMLAAQLSSNTENVYGHWDDHPVIAPGDPWADRPEEGDAAPAHHDIPGDPHDFTPSAPEPQPDAAGDD